MNRDLTTNYSYGYGFVEYTCPEDAAEAIDRLKGWAD
jgi:RNA recognition motif-containing protein